MKNISSEKLVTDLFAAADVDINGSRPWDIQVKENLFYKRLVAGGSKALGESYMDGWWECRQLDHFFDKILQVRLDQKAKKSFTALWCRTKAFLSTSPGKFRAFEIGRRHYDIGNELFTLMLDKWMNYSCAYWKQADSLDEAQEFKMDLIGRKLQLQPGMRVLDIGCGWGGLAAYMAKKYQVRVVGITVSKEQVALAKERCQGLPVDIRLMDYRDMNESFDRIVSVGMFEHVGAGRYRTFMQVVKRCLTDQGLFLLHTIAGNRSVRWTDPWISTYIFPNSMLPSSRQISTAAENLLVLEDWHSFGPDYDPTLLAWYSNFVENWQHLEPAYDRRFYRMWTYYLLACAGAFRARRNQLWQIVFSNNGVRPAYESVR
ncbi:MAG: cyclopropane fatty acyl phospholipid synthase [Desulfotignum sp.]|jgi:cyclopropane-fatty-acyl-phospholipid synthase|nr:cyclopropane fatty acyl phospholipid synthase [Desulfotignum sp.]